MLALKLEQGAFRKEAGELDEVIFGMFGFRKVFELLNQALIHLIPHVQLSDPYLFLLVLWFIWVFIAYIPHNSRFLCEIHDEVAHFFVVDLRVPQV